jgi:peptide/nickel transport system permease protein
LGFESLPGSPAPLASGPVTGTFRGYVLKRFALLVVTLILVPSLSFVAFELLSGQGGGLGHVLDALGEYLSATFFRLDLGADSFQGSTFSRTRGVLDVIGQGFAADMYLLGGGLVLGVALGIFGGAMLGRHPRSLGGRLVSFATAVIMSSPVYFLGLAALLLFSPDIGTVLKIPFMTEASTYTPPGDDPLRFLKSMWVPWLVVAAPLAAACARMCAGQLGEVLGEDYLRTARGKGVREARVLRHHALPPASAPVIALVGVNINLMITNVALMESVFNIPGSFRYIERALVNRDVDLVQGMVLEATFFIVCANFLADAIQAYLDPRVRAAA